MPLLQGKDTRGTNRGSFGAETSTYPSNVQPWRDLLINPTMHAVLDALRERGDRHDYHIDASGGEYHFGAISWQALHPDFQAKNSLHNLAPLAFNFCPTDIHNFNGPVRIVPLPDGDGFRVQSPSLAEHPSFLNSTATCSSGSVVIRNVSILHAGAAAEEPDVFHAKRNLLIDRSLSPEDGFRPMPTIFALPVTRLKLYSLVHQLPYCPTCVRQGVGDGMHCTRPKRDVFGNNRHLPLELPTHLIHNFNTLRLQSSPPYTILRSSSPSRTGPCPTQIDCLTQCDFHPKSRY